jgi:hypothetical protein
MSICLNSVEKSATSHLRDIRNRMKIMKNDDAKVGGGALQTKIRSEGNVK